MVVFPNAKINLGLQVLRKRNDGFHDIDSVFVPVNLCDALEVIPDSTLPKGTIELTLSGFTVAGDPNDNLVTRAYHLLHADFDLPGVKAWLLKRIPMGAGMGGGSADCAFMLCLLNRLFDLGLSTEKLEAYAAKLGSDCPFFIKNQPAWVTGRGEFLEPISLNLEGYWLCLVHPADHIGTAEAYRGVKPDDSRASVRELLTQPISSWQQTLHNDFENSVFPGHPKLKEIKDELYRIGASYASMTGSGSTVYGLFEERVDGTPVDANWVQFGATSAPIGK